MSLKRPDIIEHNNSNLAVVDEKNVRGDHIVANQAAMLAIPSDKLKLHSRARYPDGNRLLVWELINISDTSVIGNWRFVKTSSLVTYATIALRDADTVSNPPTEDDICFVSDVSGDTNIGKNIWATYIRKSNNWNLFSRQDSVSFISNLSDTLAVPSSWETSVNGLTVADIRNKSLTEIIEIILFPSVDPYIDSNKSATLGGVSTQVVEIGSSYTPSTTATFSDGLIKNGDNTNGPDLVGAPNRYDFRLPDDTIHQSYVTTSYSRAHTFPSRIITLGTNRWSVVVSHDIGTGTYTNNKGIESSILDASRVAGTVTANSNIITGRYMSFMGYSSNSSLTSSQIIALINKDLETDRIHTYSGVTAGVGNYVYYYYLASYGDLSNIIMDGSSPVLGAFTKLTDISVTNQYGVVATYRGYRSNATNAFTGNSLAFS